MFEVYETNRLSWGNLLKTQILALKEAMKSVTSITWQTPYRKSQLAALLDVGFTPGQKPWTAKGGASR